VRIEAIGSAVHQPWSWDQIDLAGMATHDAANMTWQRTEFKQADVGSACTQLWRRGGPRQVAPHQVSVVASGGGPVAGSLLLVCD
jgi:hypothetical protein